MKMSKFDENKKVSHKVQPCMSLIFLPHFDVFCYLLMYKPTASQNLCVLYDKNTKHCQR